MPRRCAWDVTGKLEWDGRGEAPQFAFRIPFTVEHWGPATLTVSSDTWHCGTYGYFDAAIRVRAQTVAAVGLCRPGTSSQSMMLSPGRYELLIQMLPFSRGANKVRVDRPR